MLLKSLYMAEVQYLQLVMASARLFTSILHVTSGSTIPILLGLQFLI